MHVSLAGNLGRDAEFKYMPNGDAIAKFSIPDEYYSSQDKERKTQWVNCTLFGKQADRLKPYLMKGQAVGLAGELILNSYVTKTGEQRSNLELRVIDVKLIGSKGGNQQSEPVTPPQRQQAAPQHQVDDMADDIPF